MIDFHTHILPGIDDGSPDLPETVRLLKEELRQGVARIIATPHFYAGKATVQEFLTNRNRAYEETLPCLDKLEGRLSITRAAEVYYFPGMGSARQLRSLRAEGTDLLFLEPPFSQWNGDVVKEIEEIMRRQELSVVLVHLERFYPFQKDKGPWEAILSLPVTVQLNAGSLASWTKRRFAAKMLRSGKTVVLGSDCHNMAHRPPNLMPGREILRKKLGEQILQQIDEAGETLLREHTI